MVELLFDSWYCYSLSSSDVVSSEDEVCARSIESRAEGVNNSDIDVPVEMKREKRVKIDFHCSTVVL